LIQLFFFYFVIAPIFSWSAFFTAVLTLALFEGAYMSEIIRDGINALDAGQWEAAASLGLSKLQTYRKIILPQALQIILPPPEQPNDISCKRQRSGKHHSPLRFYNGRTGCGITDFSDI